MDGSTRHANLSSRLEDDAIGLRGQRCARAALGPGDISETATLDRKSKVAIGLVAEFGNWEDSCSAARFDCRVAMPTDSQDDRIVSRQGEGNVVVIAPTQSEASCTAPKTGLYDQ